MKAWTSFWLLGPSPFLFILCSLLGEKKIWKPEKEKKDLRGTVSQRVGGYGNWACLERKEENLLIMFKISQNLVLVPKRFLGGLEHFWWTGWCNHFKNPTWKSGLERSCGDIPGLDPAAPRSSFWARIRKAVPEEREAMRRGAISKERNQMSKLQGLRMRLSRGQAHTKQGLGRLGSGLTLSPLSR